MQNATKFEAEMLSTLYFENKGNSFSIKQLPTEVQFSPIYAFASLDVDKDGDNDVVMGGNESGLENLMPTEDWF